MTAATISPAILALLEASLARHSGPTQARILIDHLVHMTAEEQAAIAPVVANALQPYLLRPLLDALIAMDQAKGGAA